MYQQLKKKYYRWKAIFLLTHRYEYLAEVNALLEEFITENLLDGGSADYLKKGREELLKKQSEIKETEKLLAFLKSK